MTHHDVHPTPPYRLLGALLSLAPLTAVTGCATTSPGVPPRLPDPVVVYVPVTSPCKVEKVPVAPLATEKLGGAGSDLYGAVQRILADRAILLGDREKLVASNTNPCPELPAK